MRDQPPLPADRALRVGAEDAAKLGSVSLDALQQITAVDSEVRVEVLLAQIAVSTSTKPTPRGWPVSRSVTMVTGWTPSIWSKSSRCTPEMCLGAPSDERAPALLLFAAARLPTARVMIMAAVATPLNHGRAPRTRSRLVQTILFERVAWLTPLRVRTDHVFGHTIMQRCGSPACQGSKKGRAWRVVGAVSLPLKRD